MQNSESISGGYGIRHASRTDPPLIVDHQIENLVGVLNPFIHPPVVQNSE